MSASTAKVARIEPAQDRFLSELQERNEKVSVFLVNGIRLSGTIAGVDRFVVLLATGGMVQIVNKHAIATIVAGGGEFRSEQPDDERAGPQQVRDEPSSTRVRRTGLVKTGNPKGRAR